MGTAFNQKDIRNEWLASLRISCSRLMLGSVKRNKLVILVEVEEVAKQKLKTNMDHHYKYKESWLRNYLQQGKREG